MNIALYGPRHSGKTSVAEYLRRTYGYERVGLADPLKDSAAYMLTQWMEYMDIEGEITRNVIERDKDSAFRTLLQWLGTDFARKYVGDDVIWIRKFLERTIDGEYMYVCDDMRFPNEAEALSRSGFALVRVYRDEGDRVRSLARANAGGIPGHSSEVETQSIVPDYTVSGTTLDALYRDVDRVYNAIFSTGQSVYA